MNNEKMGRFIFECRKEKQLTQKELADKLHITDKAVSKWERGLSCPDISLLSSLADILGVTTSELLNGEKQNISTSEQTTAVETSVDNALLYATKSIQHKLKSWQSMVTIIFSILLLLGIVICAICNFAISGTLSWAYFPISSIVFVWLMSFPIIQFRKKGILASLTALTVFIIPYLWILHLLIESSNLLMPIGIRMTAITVPYFWFIYFAFKILRKRRYLATGISLLGAIPVTFLINFTLSKIIGEPPVDVWDILSLFIIAIVTGVFFYLDFVKHKKS